MVSDVSDVWQATDHQRANDTMKKTKTEANARGSSADWRVETLAWVRVLIFRASPDVVEEVKWRKPSNPAGVPVWSLDGILCTGETYKAAVKLTFMHGAALDDPAGLFNSSLDGNTRRAIDIRQGEKFDEAAFMTLVREAVAFNTGKAKPKKS
jgi:hypothetical protein